MPLPKTPAPAALSLSLGRAGTHPRRALYRPWPQGVFWRLSCPMTTQGQGPTAPLHIPRSSRHGLNHCDCVYTLECYGLQAAQSDSHTLVSRKCLVSHDRKPGGRRDRSQSSGTVSGAQVSCSSVCCPPHRCQAEGGSLNSRGAPRWHLCVCSGLFSPCRRARESVPQPYHVCPYLQSRGDSGPHGQGPGRSGRFLLA